MFSLVGVGVDVGVFDDWKCGRDGWMMSLMKWMI